MILCHSIIFDYDVTSPYLSVLYNMFDVDEGEAFVEFFYCSELKYQYMDLLCTGLHASLIWGGIIIATASSFKSSGILPSFSSSLCTLWIVTDIL